MKHLFEDDPMMSAFVIYSALLLFAGLLMGLGMGYGIAVMFL